MEDTLNVPHPPAFVEAEQTHLRIPSKLELIQPTVEFLREKALLCGACQESRATKLTIALQEALCNAVIHGNFELSSELRNIDDQAYVRALAECAANPEFASRVVDIAVDYDGERIQWSITDEGKGFDVDRLLFRDPEAPSEIHLASGRGILIMRTFLDDLRYEAGGRRAILVLERASGKEKRRHARQPLQKRVRVSPIRSDGTVDWDAADEAITRNFSQEGLALLQSKLAGTERILIGIETEGEPLYVPAEIRHYRKVGNDMVELGCSFQVAPGSVRSNRPVQPLASVEEAVGEMIERLRAQQAVHNERRAHPRVGYTERVTILTGPNAAPVHALARDLSRSGIACIATTPLEKGIVTFRLPEAGGGLLQVQAQVLRCVKIMEGYFDIGARFLGFADAGPQV